MTDVNPEKNEPQNNRLRDEQLLTAFLDGELGEDRAAVEKAQTLIRKNTEYAELVEQWRQNGTALRSLPKYQLGSEFADRVLSEVNSLGGKSDANSRALPIGKPNLLQGSASNHLNGLIAIAALAAMLLMTLFVFPLFQGSTPVAQDAVLKTEPAANDNAQDTELEVNSRPIERQPRAKMLTGANRERSEVVAVPQALMQGSNRPVVERVMWVKLKQDHSLSDVKKTLVAESIKILESEALPDAEGVQAIFVIALPAQMRKAIAELSGNLTSEMTAFQLPASVVETGNATQLLTQRISGSDFQTEEIAELDRWFGLSGDEDESRPVRCLLMFDQ